MRKASQTDRKILREQMRDLASLRRVVKTRCAVCNVEIRGLRTHKTCSPACRLKLYRLRQKQGCEHTLSQTPGQSSARGFLPESISILSPLNAAH